MWVNYIAPHQNPKKMKRNIDSFMPIGKKPQATEEQREAGRKAWEQYLKEIKQANGGSSEIKC